MNLNHEAKANRILDMYDKVKDLLKSANSFLKNYDENEKQKIKTVLDDIKSQWASCGLATLPFPKDMWESAISDLTTFSPSDGKSCEHIKLFCEKVTENVCNELAYEMRLHRPRVYGEQPL